MKTGKITTVPKDIDYIEYALEFGDTGIPVIDLMDARGIPIKTDNYVYPTHTRKEMLVKMRTQDRKIFYPVSPVTDDFIEEAYEEFVKNLDDLLQTIKRAGINVYINADQEVGMSIEDRLAKNTSEADSKRVTIYFDYMIEPKDTYRYYFINGVTEEALDIACQHTMMNVTQFINNLRPKFS